MKRILVTGANKGIGLATVENLLHNHPDTFLILGSRDEKRGDEAVGLLTSKEPKWSERLMMLTIDVSSDESVHGFIAGNINRQHHQAFRPFGLF